MSQVDNLLDSAVVASADVAAEGYIVVGSDRFIAVPEDLKKIGVQYDHDIETVTFQCPRYWDDNDLSLHKIYINYMRPDESLGSHLCTNVKAEGDIVYFDWTISGHVTEFSGPISFLVCAKVTGTDGLEVTHWNSELNADMFVSAGLKCPDTIVRRHPDIITQLLVRMEICESNTNPDEILNRISDALASEEKTQKTISDQVDNYLLDHTALNEAVEEKVGDVSEELLSYYTDIVIPLLSSDWVLNSDTGNYEMTVTVDGVNASSTPIIGLSTASDEATEAESAAFACISDVITGENTIKFIASELPATSITVIAKGTTATHNDTTAVVTGLVSRIAELEDITKYSLNEVVVGKWIDGSNIYRRTLEIDISPTSEYYTSDMALANGVAGETTVTYNSHAFEVPFTNVEKCIRLYGFANVDGGNTFASIPCSYHSGAFVQTYYYDSNEEIVIRTGDQYFKANSKVYLTIEYTKTTE